MTSTDLADVAVQPMRHAIDDDPPWRVFTVPRESLDHVDAIGDHIYAQLRAENPAGHYGYRANIAIMVSTGVPGYPPGCSIHTENRSDDTLYHDRYRQAWREHWNCRHDLYGPAGTDPDRPRDPEDLAAAIYNREPDAITEWHNTDPDAQHMILTNGATLRIWKPAHESGDTIHWSLSNLGPDHHHNHPDINPNVLADIVARAADPDHDDIDTDHR